MAELLRDEQASESPTPPCWRSWRTASPRAEDRSGGLEEARLFSGEHDGGDALVTINAGEGGTDAQDWAEMLLRMYLRWAERRGLRTDLKEVQEGAEAGLKSATFTAHGENAYGLLSAERGVHRLVRLSPVRLGQPPPDLVRRGGRRAPRRRRRGRRDPRQGPEDRHLPRAAAPGASTSTRPTRRCASRTCPRRSSSSARTSAPRRQNRATAMALLRARLVQAELERREAEAAKEPRREPEHRLREPDPLLRRPSRTRWSRTCAPGRRRATPRGCSTATSTPSSAPSSSARASGGRRPERRPRAGAED